MAEVRVYHNPACSKSRGTLDILAARGVDVEVVEYLTEPPDRAALGRILDRIEEPPAELVRKDKRFVALGLDPDAYQTREAVIDLLLAHPELLQRPVVLRGERGLIARPSEKVIALLE